MCTPATSVSAKHTLQTHTADIKNIQNTGIGTQNPLQKLARKRAAKQNNINAATHCRKSRYDANTSGVILLLLPRQLGIQSKQS